MISTRTEGSDEPPTVTWPTPCICDTFCIRIVDAESKSAPLGAESEVSPMMAMGASDELTFR